MSLYTVAQADEAFLLATNLDSSSTEKVNSAGLSVSSSQFGTVTQNASSLTGNASYDFGSDGRVLHQWGAAYGINNIIHEIVFKRSSTPATSVTLFSSLQTTSLSITSSGSIEATFNTQSYGGNSITGITNLCDGKFHHVVMSYMDKTNGFRLYVDGVLIGTTATKGNLSYSGYVNLGSYSNTSGGNPSGYSEATIDFYAFYRSQISGGKTNAEVDTFVANHMLEFANRTVTDTPATASALAVDPSLSIGIVIVETPATASAASGDHYNSTRDGFTTLNTYLSTLPLEQWYKFDEVKSIVNYGTGGTASLAFGGNSTSEDFGGIQGSGALRITGSANDGAVYQVLNDLTMISPEITDGDFSVGFWIKANSAVADNNSEIWNAVNTVNNRYNRFTINNTGKLYFQMNTNSLHEISTTGSICDDEWHFVVGKYDQSRMYLYVDGTLIDDIAVNYSNFSAPNLMNFGSNGTAASGDFFSVSQFFISSFSAITTTVINNIIDAAQGEFQAYANMEPPKISFNNSFNDLTETRGALVDLRFNEASGAPINFGTESGVNLVATGGNITYGQLSPNTKSYRITNTNAKISEVHEFPSGTFSTNDSQTLMAYVKIDTGTAPSVINLLAASGHFGGDYGSGLGLIMVPGGAFRARLRNGAGFETITTSTTYADSQYHLVAATTDGSTLKLYVDGVEMGSTSTTRALTDKILLIIGGEADTFGATNQSKSTFIDEVSVYNYAFTAEQIFNHFQAVSQQMDWTASSLFVDPTYSAGFGPTIVETPMTASAELPKVFPFIPPMLVDAMFLDPNFEAIDNTDNLAEPMEASAQGENPGFDIGENQQVLHMDASASFPDPRVLIPGKWNASPAIANPAEMVDPAISSTLGALIKTDPLRAAAFFQLPPAYYLVSDDLWYQRLLEVDYQTETDEGLITFFNTSSDIYLGGGYDGWTAHNNRSPLRANYGYNLYDIPLPVAGAGYFDTVNRKALNLKNIALEKGDREIPVDTWTMELMIQTTKKNQFIASAFYGGNPASSLSRKKRTGIRLKDGKIAFTGLIDQSFGLLTSNSEIQFTGFKDIADGEWHHVIIQRRGDGVDQNTPRMQVWIDGKLDIQRFGVIAYPPGQIGYNSNDPDAYSDFNISAISINRGSYVLEREIILNYLASFNIIPVKADAAFATAEIGQGSQAAGNRPRALMLYFWPTAAEQTGTPFGSGPYSSTESSNVLTTLDYFTKPPQEYEGWDVFPVDITGKWVSDLVKPEAYGIGNIGTTNFIKDVSPFGRPELADIALFNLAGTFKDPVTDAARYIDLINDIDLSKFDMIMFKNYPNESNEKDAFSGAEVVDAYFNLRESKLFEDFLKSLRAAVDTGISLMVATPQLALDLKIVDRVEVVPTMDDELPSDPYAPTQMFGIAGAATLPTAPEYKEPLGWWDTWKNNRTRIVNTHPGITDYPGLIKTQQAFWYNTDEFRWGGPDRIFAKYEHKDALAVGDEFVISTTGRRADLNPMGYFATPFENVKAGKIITAFANTVRRGLDEIENPYRNYAQSIIVEPGDVLDGTQVGGKIFVNFTEEINKVTESASIELTSDYWVNYAYENGAISLEDRDELLLQDFVKTETPYWSLNGMNLLQQRSGDFELDTDINRAGIQKEKVKTRKVNKNGGLSFQSVPSGSVFFSSTYSWQYPLAAFEMPSMPTRGFRWLSNREVLEGTVLRPQAFVAQSEMPNAAAVPDRITDFKAQAMVATATIEETQFSTGEKQVLALPMTATADIVKPGSTIGVAPMLSTAKMFDNSRSNVASEDQVVLYLMHVDPILYIREDVIK